MRIVFLGEEWFGSCSRACANSLRRLGCDVTVVDHREAIPRWRSLSLRLVRRVLLRQMLKEYNEEVWSAVCRISPDLVLASKAPMLLPGMVKRIRASGVRVANYYPDSSVFTHTPWLPDSIGEYDHVAFAHQHCRAEAISRLSLRSSSIIPHGYDQDLHTEIPLSERDREEFAVDIAVIATHTRHKELVLDELAKVSAGRLRIGVWGNLWHENCRSKMVRQIWRGPALEGQRYVKAIRAAKITLGLMSGPVGSAVHGDSVSTRSFEIPACGGFMMHERTVELGEYYSEDQECVAFGDVLELVEKALRYCSDGDARMRIATAGRKRCVPQYSYDNRMMALLVACQGE